MKYTETVRPYEPYTHCEPEAVNAAFQLLAWSGMPLKQEDVESMPEEIGDVPAHPHQRMTPYRLAHYLAFWFRESKFPRFTYFPNEDPKIDQLIVIEPIDFWACCSHHMLPFFGKVYFGYIPQDRLVGLSMIPLWVKEYCSRPWVQEHMTHGIAEMFWQKLDPIGLGVITEASHTCQMLDLGGPPVPRMKFSVVKGAFFEHGASTRSEFLQLIRGGLTR